MAFRASPKHLLISLTSGAPKYVLVPCCLYKQFKNKINKQTNKNNPNPKMNIQNSLKKNTLDPLYFG